MKISCSMISWNEAKTIDLALKSVADYADEVIIIDTGSFDGTKKIAREWMDKLDLSGQIKETQIRNLGEARLESFTLCSGDWVLMQDSNLVLSNALKAEMKKHVMMNPDAVLAIKSLNLVGDYEHYFKPRPFMAHHRVFVDRDKATWCMALDRPEFSGKKINAGKWAVNLSRVRPSWRSWYRGEPFDYRYYKRGGRRWIGKTNTQNKWMTSNQYHSIIEYVIAEKGLTLEDVKRVSPEWYLNQIQHSAVKLQPDLKRCLSETIKIELKHPRYKLIYEQERIIGRCPEL